MSDKDDVSGSILEGILIGVVLLGIFKLFWFFARIAFWLILFLLLCLGAGFMALTRIGRQEPELVGDGEYSNDRTRWLDRASGTAYPVSATEHETCTVQALESGTFWRRTTLSQLMRGGAICRYKLLAVHDTTGETVAEWVFPQEARHNITLDHLDPAYAAMDRYGLGDNRGQMLNALQALEAVLAARGWESADSRREEHWYSRVYARPVIQWQTPVDALTAA